MLALGNGDSIQLHILLDEAPMLINRMAQEHIEFVEELQHPIAIHDPIPDEWIDTFFSKALGIRLHG
jgi:hypothetical protein